MFLFTVFMCCFFFSSRRRHTRCYRDWSSDVCSSDLLLLAEARIRVVAPEVSAAFVKPIRGGRIEWIPRKFAAGDLDGATLAIAATSAPGVNASVFREAEARGILCNAVDDIENCHFYYGSIVQRGDLQIAISTNGKSPALAQRLRQELDQPFGP